MEQAINGVLYEQQKEGCLVRERDQKRHFTINKKPITTHNGLMENQSVITVITGNEYIDPWNSYLSFNLTAYSPSLQGIRLNGGTISLIQNIVLKDKFGREVERCEEMHRLNSTMLRATFGDDWMDAAGCTRAPDALIGDTEFSRVLITAGDPGIPQYISTVAPIAVHLPLPLFLGLFRTTPLLPPHLMDGMEIWITWTPAAEAFQVLMDGSKLVSWPFVGPPVAATENIYAGDPYLRYTISDLELTTDNYFLEHDLHNMITREHESNGLPLKYFSWSWDSTIYSETGLTSNTNMLAPVRKTYTNATKILSQSRNIPAVDPSVVIGDATYLLLRDNIEMFYDTINDQKYYPETKDYMQRNGRVFPLTPTKTLNQTIYYWKQALGNNRFYPAPFSKDLITAWTGNNLGPTWLKSLAKNPNIAPNISSGLMGSSSKLLAGMRIDGSAPIDCYYSIPLLTDTQLTQGTHSTSSDVAQKNDIKTSAWFRRRLDTFIEHVRYVMIHKDGNKIYS